MKKKNIIIAIIIIIMVIALGFGIYYFVFKDSNEDTKMTDAMKFKEEYESLNGKKTSNGQSYRKLDIKDNNPFVYATEDDILKLIDEKETFAVYFGYNSCPWCRSVLPTLINVSSELGINKIYYVDIHDIRDTLTVNSKGKVETTKKGSDGYYKLLEAFDSVLSDYSLTDSKGKEVDAKEKRIYAPNIISVVDGTPSNLTGGISDLQTNAYMELTEEMITDMHDKIKCTLDCLKDSGICTLGY